MAANAFCDLARECFQFLVSDYGFREHHIDEEKYTNSFTYSLTDDDVWFLIEGSGFNAELSVSRHDPNEVSPWPRSNINIELLLATRRGDGEDYFSSEIARGELPLEQKMSYLSEGLQIQGTDLVSGNLAAVEPQIYIAEHYNGEENLHNPPGILNPRGRRLIGLFSSFQMADTAIKRLSSENGFRHSKEKFVVSCYSIDKTWWNCGFSEHK